MEYDIFHQGNKWRIYQVNANGEKFGPAIGEHRDEGDAIDHLAELELTNEEAMRKLVMEAIRKEVSGFSHPAGDFLVVEDPEKVTTWHLPVKKNGKPDRALAGAAWAALFSSGGYRGKKYEGPQVSSAKSKLKALYKSQDWETPKAEATAEMYGEMPDNYIPGYYTARSFDDFDTLEKAHDLKVRLDKRRDQFNVIFEKIWYDPEISFQSKASEWQTLFDSFIEVYKKEAGVVEELDPGGNALYESMTASQVNDAPDEMVAELAENDIKVESGRRAPVLVDFQILHPGPGNKHDRHYYGAEMLERDIHVFEGADVFVTDHREQERSERTKVGIVKKCPSKFTESKAPIAQVLIYDPDQAEKARNRNDAKELKTLECSIYGSGKSVPGEINGVKYNIVTELTEGKFLELVSKAGARGHAIRLSESDETEVDMKDKKEVPAEEVEETEVAIHEQDAGAQAPDKAHDGEQEKPKADEKPVETPVSDPGETKETAEAEKPKLLSEADVKGYLAKTSNLPVATYQRLVEREYADQDALEAEVKSELAYIENITGAGKPNAGATIPNKPEKKTRGEVRESQDAINKKFLGL